MERTDRWMRELQTDHYPPFEKKTEGFICTPYAAREEGFSQLWDLSEVGDAVGIEEVVEVNIFQACSAALPTFLAQPASTGAHKVVTTTSVQSLLYSIL